MPIELQWPEKQTLDVLDYSCDLSGDLVAGETITDISVSASPIGPEELTVQSVALQGKVIVVWVAGGVGGRGYLIRLDARTSAGRIFDVLATLPMSRTLTPYPVPDAISAGFSTPVTYHMPVLVQASADLAGQGNVIGP
jgi:hypothetical protein